MERFLHSMTSLRLAMVVQICRAEMMEATRNQTDFSLLVDVHWRMFGEAEPIQSSNTVAQSAEQLLEAIA
jgi:hypothetical protein